MNWYRVMIIALATTLVAGCGGDDTDVPSNDLSDTTQSLLVDSAAAVDESFKDSEGEKFEPPFSRNASFFSPPKIRQSEVLSDDPGDTVVENGQHANVRVIGFSQIDDAETQALISVEGNLQSVRPGDTVHGVTVVALNAPKVTLQQRNERWTVALFSQPLVNAQVGLSPQRPRMSIYQSRAQRSRNFQDTRNITSDSGFQSDNSLDEIRSTFANVESSGGVVNNLPPVPSSPSDNGVLSEIELPEDLDLPEPPSLPGLEESFDQELPGIDEIPQLPSN